MDDSRPVTAIVTVSQGHGHVLVVFRGELPRRASRTLPRIESGHTHVLCGSPRRPFRAGSAPPGYGLPPAASTRADR